MSCLLFHYLLILFIILSLMKNKYITKTNKLFYALIIIFFICSIIIYASLNKNIKYLLLCNKELNTTYWKRPKITGWQISHFLCYSVAGIMVPRVYWILLVGVFRVGRGVAEEYCRHPTEHF